MKKKLTCIVIAIAMMSVSLVGCIRQKPNTNFEFISNNGDMEKISSRMLAELYDAELDMSKTLEFLNDDGSFSNIDYDSSRTDYWEPTNHLNNIKNLCIAYFSSGNLHYNKIEVFDAISSTMKYWGDKNYKCSWNGWYQEIGSPMRMADIRLFPTKSICGSKSIDKEIVNKFDKYANFDNQSIPGARWNHYERTVDTTGGNLTDIVINQMKVEVVQGGGSYLMWLRSLVENELEIRPEIRWNAHSGDAEGIRADQSFMQHFELLYFGGYGEVFADGINSYLRYTHGTQYALSTEAINNYSDFVLEGFQYAYRNNYRDINASGRGIARIDGLHGIQKQVLNACNEILAYEGIARRDDLMNLLQTRGGDVDQGVSGGIGQHKYFWKADYQVYNGAGYMATVRHASKNTKISEVLNGENALGYYQGVGATQYYIDGSEYYNALPLWDWTRVPGTTTRQGYMPNYTEGPAYTKKGKTSFVGGVSNGKYGMSGFDFKQDSVSGRKAYFMFPEGVYNLGADINSSKQENIHTNINQTLLRGDVTYSTSGSIQTAATISNLSGQVDWLNNNGISYISKQPINVFAGEKTGDWKAINTRLNSTMHTDNMLDIGINHGVKPNNASYEYMVLMNVDAEQTGLYHSNSTITTIENNKNVQAVWHSGLGVMQAMFYKGGEIKLPTGQVLSVSRGCAVICEPSGDGFNIYVANPLQTKVSMTVTLDGVEQKVEFSKGNDGGNDIMLKF